VLAGQDVAGPGELVRGERVQGVRGRRHELLPFGRGPEPGCPDRSPVSWPTAGEDKVVIVDGGRITALPVPASTPATVGSLLRTAERHTSPER